MDKIPSVVAKVEWHPGELYPRVGFIVTDMARSAENVVAFYKNEHASNGSRKARGRSNARGCHVGRSPRTPSVSSFTRWPECRSRSFESDSHGGWKGEFFEVPWGMSDIIPQDRTLIVRQEDMMGEDFAEDFEPAVRGDTNSVATDIEAFMRRFEDHTYYVPDYQRDSSQWNLAKRSLFIESLINNDSSTNCLSLNN